MLSRNEQDSVRETAFAGTPYCYNKIFSVKPLTLKEILKMDRIEYEKKLAILLLTEIDIAKVIKEKTGQEPKLGEIRPLTYLL